MTELKTFDPTDKNLLLKNTENTEVMNEMKNALSLILDGGDVEESFRQCLTWEFDRYKYVTGAEFVIRAIVERYHGKVDYVPYPIWINLRFLIYLLDGEDSRIVRDRRVSTMHDHLEHNERRRQLVMQHIHRGVTNGNGNTRNPSAD